MLILIILLVLAMLIPLFAARQLRRRTDWSNSWVALTAALPFPLLSAGLAAYLAGYERLMKSVDGQPMDLAITIGIGGSTLYLIGVIVAAVTARAGRKPSADVDEVADIFS